MENTPDKEIMIPLIAHEGEMARLERIIRRLWITILVCLAIIVGTNAAWIWYESSFEDVVVTQENSDGYNNYVGNDGSIYNYPEQNDEQ